MRPDDEKSVELMLALKQGRQSALNDLMAIWEGPLLRFTFRYVQNEAEARDLVQETFVRIYLCRERYREGSSFVTWAFTIAANLCRNHRRWLGRHPTISLDATEGDEPAGRDKIASPGESPDRFAQRMERLEALRGAVAVLPHDLRAALLLHEYEELSYREIAGILGCSEKGVESRLARARLRLRKSLKSLFEASDARPEELLPARTRA